MSMELLKSIESAEAKAEDIRLQAQREAREMLKSVEEACVQNERAAAIDQRAMVQRIIEDAREASQKRIASMAGQEQAARDAVTAAAKGKLDTAANLIFERVVQDGHR